MLLRNGKPGTRPDALSLLLLLLEFDVDELDNLKKLQLKLEENVRVISEMQSAMGTIAKENKSGRQLRLADRAYREILSYFPLNFGLRTIHFIGIQAYL